MECFYEETIIEWFKGSTTSERLQEMLQGLISGDMVTFEDYFIKSNRESGFGRYDIALIPKDTKNKAKGMILKS